MNYTVLSESKKRIRIRTGKRTLPLREADRLEYYLRAVRGVRDVKVHERTGNIVIFTDGKNGKILQKALSDYHVQTAVRVPAHTGRELYRELEDKLFRQFAGRLLRLVIPVPVRNVLTVTRGVPRILMAARTSVIRRRNLPNGSGRSGPERVPPAAPGSVFNLRLAAAAVSLLTGQIGTASSLLFADRLGEILKEWTVRRQADLLADRIQTGDERVWVILDGADKTAEVEKETDAKDLQGGERIRLRAGDLVPVDGVLAAGEVMVDQAELTGSHERQKKTAGSYLYAGSVVESGECVLIVEETAGEGRYGRIVGMLQSSGRLTPDFGEFAGKDTRFISGAFLMAGLAAGLVTGSAVRMLPFMLADVTHTMNAVLPAAVIGAMREAGAKGVVVKSGPALLKLRQADTILFNKRGILTEGKPSVVRVDTFNGFEEEDILKTAACLEEHFPHSMADAVVREAERRGLLHEEQHTKVEYVSSHGIASTLNGERVVIGSKHFVVDDENVPVPEEEQEKYKTLLKTHSHLYMAVGGRLVAVLSLEDPIRKNVPGTIGKLREAGFKKIVLMTGDSEHAARTAAETAGFDAYYSGVSAEDKEAFIEKERREGRVTVMVGDGINDVPALRAADVGIAVTGSVPLAAKNADILIPEGDLKAILWLRSLSDRIAERVRKTGTRLLPVNAALGSLGTAGVITAGNAARVASGLSLLTVLHSMTNYSGKKTLLPDLRSAAAVMMAQDLASEEEGGQMREPQEILSELGVLPVVDETAPCG